MKFLIQVYESLIFAYQALRSNILRTTLSLLGVSVGIFAIVAVFTAVDSLNKNIRSEIDSFAGSGVLYVGKWPWIMQNNYPWWKYLNRPEMKYTEFQFLKDNLKSAKAIAIIDNGRSASATRGSSSMDVNMTGASYDYNQITSVPVQYGRYFLPIESENALNVVIIGAKVSENLQATVGDQIKLNGIKFQIIGIIEKKGTDLLSFGGTPDEKVFIPYSTFSAVFQKDKPAPDIAIKAMDDDLGQENLEGEVTGLMRSLRSIKPKQESNFAVNRLDGLNQFFDGIFAALNVAGALIAGFSLLVGGFGIANIMFVSVKERTNIIGIQKSLGAKNYFILFQFLFEAVFLSLIGGLVGIGLVVLLTLIPQDALPLVLSMKNIVTGLFISSFIGILSGIIPAWVAAKMDPVIAIRSK
ncbi:ABC transporter permease [Aquirufa antheringensis]|jgi:putative ABC transport system permease protein|uniref:FtsX-like permease family protein n=1 Tax=Aquirufa antheringensis TaxID=2516559 RepID=A0A4V2IVQ2_9BACT|nr:ABC transporter permease [Aquirufa antheringensis]MCZ2486119.1 FtsX-like permease family protein [Aquirufa antheringensis]MCZ2486190.1 FtsX-like permease family protein [Aquirufa antheringensis]MCZ2489029.1 FtsX-like permease family protein [Aquirufa antheringensis]TBH73105.1 FtsX-like permease family protein [Aquirufa antheringensis]USQ04607.1 FtsX-like permease family protein [Aquirufa antheringensis]